MLGISYLFLLEGLASWRGGSSWGSTGDMYDFVWSIDGVVVSQRGSGKMEHACKLQVPAFLLIQVCHMRALGIGISTIQQKA